MAISTGKTIALILLIVVILFFVFYMTPFSLSPLGIFPGFIRSIENGWVKSISIWPKSYFRYIPFSFITFALLVIWIFVIVWVYRDAERRGMNGVLWALLVFIGNIIGLLIYLIVRSDTLPLPRATQTTHPCPSCQKPVASNFAFCPHCGARMEEECPECRKPVEKGWKVCPHCGKELGRTG